MNTRRTDRRRRVLREDVVASATAVTAQPQDVQDSYESERKQRSYFSKAKRRHQPRLTDLIPVRTWPVCLVGIGLVAILGSIVWLDQFIRANADATTFVAFLFGDQASIANWMQSTGMLVTGVICYLIYVLRSHRCDDYKGTYRLWSGLAVICIVASATSQIHLLPAVISAFDSQGWNEKLDAAMLLRVVAIVAVLLVSVRTWFELRHSRLATTSFYVAVIAYFGSVFIANGVFNSVLNELTRATSRGGLMLLAHFAWFYSVLLFARYVYLDAHGLIKTVEKPAKQKSKKTAAESKNTRQKTKPVTKKTESAKETNQRPREVAAKNIPATEEKVEKQPVKSSTKEVDDQPSEMKALAAKAEAQTLSKSERRRMRKLAKRNQRAA